METKTDPTAVAPFDLTRGKLPSEANPHLMDFVAALRHRIEKEHPDTITDLVLHSPRNLKYEPDQVTIYVFGTFRSHYPPMEKLSGSLASSYHEATALPIIKPITRNEWKMQVEHKGKAFRDIKNRGIVFYTTRRAS
jgi:hypothetical protein